MDPNRNARWSRCIAEELRRGGAGLAVLCPGSRNSPLLFPLAHVFGTDAVSHIDERSAGFLALGFIRASGRPAVVCVTSGSAVANLLPALVEAHADRLPLIVVTADRPWEAIGCGAPQALRQEGLLTPAVVREVFLGEPSDDDLTLRALRRETSRLVQTAGPTHLNVPLRDPLPPLEDPAWTPAPVSDLALRGRADGAPFTQITTHLSGGRVTLPPWWTPGLRGLIAVGPGAPAEGLADLARASGFPVLADAASGLRHDGTPHLVTLADSLVGSDLGQEPFDLAVLIGSQPTARATYEFLAKRARRVITLGAQPLDPHAHADWTCEAPGAVAAVAAAVPGPGDTPWRDRWLSAEAAGRARLAQAVAGLPWGEAAAIHAAANAVGFRFLLLASSMAVRHANLLLGAGASRPVLANRGVNGIDGTLGTFLGASRHLGPGVALVGDLAFLHDLPALAAAGGSGAIVVLNNGGGAIFDYLPVARVPGYERWIRTAHDRRLAPAAELFGLVLHEVRDRAGLDAALSQARDGRLHLIEGAVHGLDAVGEHRRLLRVVRGEKV